MIDGHIIAVPGFGPSFSFFELLVGILDCFTCSTNCDLIIQICCLLSIGPRLFYRKWIAEKHPVWKSQNADSTAHQWNNYLWTHTLRSLCVAQVQSATSPSQAMHFNKIRTPSNQCRVYILQSHAKRFWTLPRPNPPRLNPSYLTSRLLRVIRCGICSVFCFFVGSLTSTLAWPDWFTKGTCPDFLLDVARSLSNAIIRVSKSLW